MSFYIRLNKDINGQYLLSRIQSIIYNYAKQKNIKNTLLCIELKDICHDTDAYIPKLEYMEIKDDRKNNVSE